MCGGDGAHVTQLCSRGRKPWRQYLFQEEGEGVQQCRPVAWRASSAAGAPGAGGHRRWRATPCTRTARRRRISARASSGSATPAGSPSILFPPSLYGRATESKLPLGARGGAIVGSEYPVMRLLMLRSLEHQRCGCQDRDLERIVRFGIWLRRNEERMKDEAEKRSSASA